MHLSSSSSTSRSGLEPSPMKCRLSSSGSTGLLGAGCCPSGSGGAKLPEPPAGDWPSLQIIAKTLLATSKVRVLASMLAPSDAHAIK